MTISLTWSPINDYQNHIDDATFSRVVELLKATSKADTRDLNTATVSKFKYKINNKISNINWIKVHVAKNNQGVIQAVIVYHFIKHRYLGFSPWAVSLGFDSNLLGATADLWRNKYLPNSSNPNYPNTLNPFLQLLISINSQIKIDLPNFSTRSPDGYQFVVYDEVDLAESDADTPGADPDNKRRKTNIGELGWIAQYATPRDLGNAAFSLRIRKIESPGGWGRKQTEMSSADRLIVETVASFS